MTPFIKTISFQNLRSAVQLGVIGALACAPANAAGRVSAQDFDAAAAIILRASDNGAFGGPKNFIFPSLPYAPAFFHERSALGDFAGVDFAHVDDEDDEDGDLPDRRLNKPAQGAPAPEPPQPPKAQIKTPHQPPKSVLPLADQRMRALDELFGRLATADAQTAAPIAAGIQRVWSHSGSDTADLLFRRAQIAFAANQQEAASHLMDAAVEMAPRWAFALVQRAAIREALGEDKGAKTDLEAAIALDPRQFAAYADLGVLRLREGEKKGALEALRKSLAINPAQPKIERIIETLTPDVEGRDI